MLFGRSSNPRKQSVSTLISTEKDNRLLATIALATIVTSVGPFSLPEDVRLAPSAVTTAAIRQFEQSLNSLSLAGSSVTLDPRQATCERGKSEMSIADIFALATATFPDEEWEKLPKDLSTEWHQHLYE